ncbi:MAG: MBL fold metallo-hydrolase [Alphaproteobacteria bacterium]|nr:MBL fold metallo-hydrolase [Alphaproteobacteria bacterium]
MTDIPFVRDMDFEYGACASVSPLIRRVVANNPSPFTYMGTGTYIIGTGEVAVIDPGPLLPAHVEAILAALAPDEKVSHIFITHTHLDHSPAAAPLQARTGAVIYGKPLPSHTTEGDTMEEDIDDTFTPDHIIEHGQIITHADWTLEALHTPGHLANHICYALHEEKVLFTGDHVMGWATSVVIPPDGNMRDYMHSLDLLLTRDDEIYLPTHGPAIENPKAFVQAYINHRKSREAQIIAQLKVGNTQIKAIVKTLYADTDKRLHGAAALSVFAHIEDLVARDIVCVQDATPATLDASYRLASA